MWMMTTSEVTFVAYAHIRLPQLDMVPSQTLSLSFCDEVNEYLSRGSECIKIDSFHERRSVWRSITEALFSDGEWWFMSAELENNSGDEMVRGRSVCSLGECAPGRT